MASDDRWNDSPASGGGPTRLYKISCPSFASGCRMRKLLGLSFLLTVLGLVIGSPSNSPSWAASPGSTAGPCDNSDLPTLLGAAHGILDAGSPALHEILLGRLDTCRSAVDTYVGHLPPLPSPTSEFLKWLPTPTPLTTPPPNCTSSAADPLPGKNAQIYEVLARCIAFVKAVNSAPTPSPAPSIIPARIAGTDPKAVRVIYTLALASDAPTSARISFDLAAQLLTIGSLKNKDPFTEGPVTFVVQPEPGWTLAQFQTQCAADGTTAGAIVALPPATNSSSDNWVFFSRSWTNVQSQVIVVDCEPSDFYQQNRSSYVTWSNNTELDRTGSRWSISIGSIVGLASAAQIFKPSSTTSTANTYTIASPAPGASPLSSYTQTNSTTTASSGNTSAAATVALLNPFSSTSGGLASAVDAQTKDASSRLARAMASELLEPCSHLTAPPTPAPTQKQLPLAVWQPTQCFWFQSK